MHLIGAKRHLVNRSHCFLSKWNYEEENGLHRGGSVANCQSSCHTPRNYAMKILKSVLSLCMLLPVLSGCACTLELSSNLRPREATIKVGESTTPTFEIMSCGGREMVLDTIVWTSANPQIASVDRTTGTITGRSVGQVEIHVVAQELELKDVVRVAVIAP